MSSHDASGSRDPFSLCGRRALVTGGSGGIGAAICRRLGQHGAEIIFTTRPGGLGKPKVKTLVEELRALGREASAIEVDVRSVKGVRAAIDDVFDSIGPVDVLVNNAGTNVQQPALEVDEDTWDLISDINLKGLFFTTQAVARRARDSADAVRSPLSVVNIASQMGFVGWRHRAAYCSSKGGVVSLTRALAVEWAPLGIRVNGVAPTFIHTPLADKMLADPEFHKDVIGRLPLARIGQPEDVAHAVVYLCGDAANMVTGHTMLVDGGWTAQ